MTGDVKRSNDNQYDSKFDSEVELEPEARTAAVQGRSHHVTSVAIRTTYVSKNDSIMTKPANLQLGKNDHENRREKEEPFNQIMIYLIKNRGPKFRSHTLLVHRIHKTKPASSADRNRTVPNQRIVRYIYIYIYI